MTTAVQTVEHFDEDAWDDLLNYIEERRVIPIVGPDLLRVDTDQGPRLLYEWLAEKLAVKLSVDPSGLPQPLTLNDVVCSYLGQRGRREEAYTRLRSIMREVQIAPPMALRAAPSQRIRADETLFGLCHRTRGLGISSRLGTRMAVANPYSRSRACTYADGSAAGQSVQNVALRWANGSAGCVNDLLNWARGDLLVLVFGELTAASLQKASKHSMKQPRQLLPGYRRKIAVTMKPSNLLFLTSSQSS